MNPKMNPAGKRVLAVFVMAFFVSATMQVWAETGPEAGGGTVAEVRAPKYELPESDMNFDKSHITEEKDGNFIFRNSEGKEIKKIAHGIKKEHFTGDDVLEFYKTNFGNDKFWRDWNVRSYVLGKQTTTSGIVAKNGKYALITTTEAYDIQKSREKFVISEAAYRVKNYTLYSSSGEVVWTRNEVDSEYSANLLESYITQNGNVFMSTSVTGGWLIMSIDRHGNEVSRTMIEQLGSISSSQTGAVACLEGRSSVVPYMRVVYIIDDSLQFNKRFEYSAIFEDGRPTVTCGNDSVELWFSGKEARTFTFNGVEVK